MQQRTILGLGATAAAALALAPAGASAQLPAGTTSLAPGACISGVSNLPTNGIALAGWPANASVSADPQTGGGGGSALVDAAGNGVLNIDSYSNAVAGNDEAFTDSSVIFSASGAAPLTVPVRVVNAPVVRKGNVAGKSPRTTVTWSFAAFAQPGQTIYGHVRFRGRTVRNFRFGKAGACGGLTRRAAALPVRKGSIRSGKYFIQFDTSTKYKRNKSAPSLTQSIYTTYRR